MELPVYSIAICPPPEVVQYIKMIKEELYAQIGRYASCHAEAHISLTQFRADERAARRYTGILESICEGVLSFEFRLHGLSVFSQGTVYVTPDPASREHFLALCEQIRQGSGRFRNHSFSTVPHLTIARQLDERQVDTAFRLLQPRTIETRFCCTGIALRTFDAPKGQYTIVHRIPFGNHQKALMPKQAALW
ncbi:MAG TPA: 2'-5' RNA ligase family protein [Chitinophagaceae bacterium]|nr:2'-5' RNA ligase family protein [Chitinophagaceae bacterium]